MKTVPVLYEEMFRVRLFECGANGRVTPGSVCRLAQEAADGHCRTVGMSLAELRAQNKMWILTRFRLVMQNYPRLGDWIKVGTWASSRTDGLRAFREFQFLDSEGSVLGRGVSIWLMLEVNGRRPLRLPTVINEMKNPARSDRNEFEVPRLKAPEAPEWRCEFQVGWKDLDVNNHANNVHYVEWALEGLPPEVNRNGTLHQLDIEFLAEAFYGDRVDSGVQSNGSGYSHILRSGSGKMLALLKTHWNF